MIWFHRRRKVVKPYEEDKIRGEKCERLIEICKVTNISAAALDKLLGKFFKDVHKQNGGMYEPDSI